ncbi:hypothetical protein EBZ70_01065 [bacterium]|nr:hypothetical protein [bacterium]
MMTSSSLRFLSWFVVVAGACLTSNLTGYAAGIYTPPSLVDRVEPAQATQRVKLPAGPAALAQAAIDRARQDQPEAFLVLEAEGDIEIRSEALRLGSRMSLLLSPRAGLRAAPAWTAGTLLQISDAESVTVSSAGPGPALIDGAGAAVVGILIERGRRICLDELVLQGCGLAGIDFQGVDPGVLNEAGSVTRCVFTANGDGLRVDRSGGFMCLDNVFRGQAGTALTITSTNSVVAGNTFAQNQAAIRSGSDRGVITRNAIFDYAALAFTPASGGNLISENRGSAARLVVALAGRTQQLFRNSWTGSVRIAPGSADMVLVGNLGLTVDGDALGARVFNPPTFKQPHTSPVIVPGLGRFDFTVPGGKAASKQEKPVPVDLATVQTALDAARAEHPGTVLVLKLTGEYVSRSPEGLRLPPDTCVILEGRILADLGLPLEPIWVRGEATSQLITLPATGYSSVSGGRLDGARQASYPLNAKTGSLALIEGVQLASGARDGLYTKTRNAADPLFVYQCQAYANGSRGIWAHVATRVHSIGNTCISNNMDGIDLDAAAIDCTALFNTSNANRRHGVFIEEGITHNIVFGNQLSGNGGAGVHVWNEEVKKNTGPNVIAANACTANRRGVSNGGRAADISAHGNLFFNNICRDNWLNGVLAGNSHARGSYFAQSDIGGNHGADIVGAEQGAFLATPALQ